MSSTTSTMLDCRDDYERAHQTIIHLEDAIFSLDGIEPGIVKYLKGKLKEAHLRCEAEKQKFEIERNSLRHYIKIKRGELARGYADLFYAVEDRDGRQCKNCNSALDLTIDHIKPLAEWGTNDLDNLQILCRSCNSKKWRTYHE